jgi:uncharacterized protein (DUF342 family)
MLPDDDLISRTTELLTEAAALNMIDGHAETTSPVDEPVPASVEVIIDDDQSTARVSLFPPRGAATLLTPDTVVEQLDAAGVAFGINYEKIGEGVFACNTERRTVYALEVAHQRPPRDAVEEHLAVVYSPDEEPPEERAGRVDHHAWSRVPIVPAGTVLARVIPAVPGRDGITVTGEPIPHRTKKPTHIEAGDNTVRADHEVRAAIDGVFSQKNGSVAISPLLEVREDVDYGTGNIDFNGDVLLHGSVADGFTITCTGALRSEHTLDVFGVQCGSLEVRQGIIGHGDAVAVVDGPLKTRFLQNATIQAAGSVSVGASVLASRITTNEKIHMGRNSSVIGSVMRSSEGVVAYNIGSPGAAATELYLGIDFDVDRRLSEIRDYSITLGTHLRDVRLRLQRHPEDTQRQRLTDMQNKLQTAITQLGQQAGDLVAELDRNENADLIVQGTVYTGTYIEICHRSLHVDRPLKACRIYLDRSSGSVKVEPLNKRAVR